MLYSADQGTKRSSIRIIQGTVKVPIVVHQCPVKCVGMVYCIFFCYVVCTHPMSVAPFFLVQNDQKQTDPGSLEDLSRDEPDRALPLSEPMGIHRRSPLIRNRKTGSMEVKSHTHTHTQPSIVSNARGSDSSSSSSSEI